MSPEPRSIAVHYRGRSAMHIRHVGSAAGETGRYTCGAGRFSFSR